MEENGYPPELILLSGSGGGALLPISTGAKIQLSAIAGGGGVHGVEGVGGVIT